MHMGMQMGNVDVVLDGYSADVLYVLRRVVV